MSSSINKILSIVQEPVSMVTRRLYCHLLGMGFHFPSYSQFHSQKLDNTIARVTSFYATRQSILGSNWSYFPTTLLMLDTSLWSLSLFYCLPWFMAFWYLCGKVFWWTSPGTWWTTYSPCCWSSPSNPGYWGPVWWLSILLTTIWMKGNVLILSE